MICVYPGSAPATEPEDDGDFGDFITGPSFENFGQSGASPQIPSTAQAQDKEKAPVKSVDNKPVQSNTPPPVQLPPTSQHQAPPTVPTTKEEKKG